MNFGIWDRNVGKGGENGKRMRNVMICSGSAFAVGPWALLLRLGMD